jgi:hypothetical protein
MTLFPLVRFLNFYSIGFRAIVKTNSAPRATLSDILRGDITFPVQSAGRSEELLRTGDNAAVASFALFRDNDGMG